MTFTVRDLKDLQVTVREDLVLMNLFLDQSVHMLHWMTFLPVMLMLMFVIQDPVWTMMLAHLNMGNPTGTGFLGLV
jgi:hypothetical protein